MVEGINEGRGRGRMRKLDRFVEEGKIEIDSLPANQNPEPPPPQSSRPPHSTLVHHPIETPHCIYAPPGEKFCDISLPPGKNFGDIFFLFGTPPKLFS